jgi:hypothetical protein
MLGYGPAGAQQQNAKPSVTVTSLIKQGFEIKGYGVTTGGQAILLQKGEEVFSCQIVGTNTKSSCFAIE